MADGANLAGIQLPTDLQHDGGARLLAVAIEQPALGSTRWTRAD